MSAAPISPLVESVFALAAQQFKPPPRLSISEWANRNFVLSSEDSAEPGQYRTARAPYQREILDALGEPEVEDLVLCCAAQTVKTVAIKIWIAYYVKEDPSAILFLLPGLDLARRVSRQRLAPMFRDVPLLRGLLEEGANRASNATLEKSFPGGVLFLVGANSPAGLSSVPVRIVFADEVNRYPASAGSEGSPLALAEKRTANFWNRKKVKASTPTDDHGMITLEYEKTDMRQYHVPCPGCSEAAGELDGFQVLEWKKLIIDKDPAVETTYACAHCGAALTEASKPWMLEHGRWVARRPEVVSRRGYQLSALYSPFFTWAQIASEWREAMHHREDKNLLRVFVNTVLAEPYNDDAEVLDSSELMGRREDYPCPVPDGVTILTAAVDVQVDRLELLVRGWGKGQESWLVDRKLFEGDTSKLEGMDPVPSADPTAVPLLRASPWQRLDEYLERAAYLHARGVRLRIACAMVDSGFQTTVVYAFCKTRAARWIYALKGVSGFGKSPLGQFTKANRQRVRVYPVAVDELKATLYRRLKIGTPGAGYVHFSREHCDEEYFRQLTSEQLKRKQVRGYPVRYWEKAPGVRNEALDLEVYAYAAFLRLSEKPDVFLEAQRAVLLERAVHAARGRRLKADPRQRAFLEAALAPEPAAEAEPGVQTSAGPAGEPDLAEPEPGLGAEEHKVAAELDAGEPEPPPAEKPRIAMRPPRWR